MNILFFIKDSKVLNLSLPWLAEAMQIEEVCIGIVKALNINWRLTSRKMVVEVINNYSIMCAHYQNGKCKRQPGVLGHDDSSPNNAIGLICRQVQSMLQYLSAEETSKILLHEGNCKLCSFAHAGKSLVWKSETHLAVLENDVEVTSSFMLLKTRAIQQNGIATQSNSI